MTNSTTLLDDKPLFTTIFTSSLSTIGHPGYTQANIINTLYEHYTTPSKLISQLFNQLESIEPVTQIIHAIYPKSGSLVKELDTQLTLSQQ